MINVTEKEWQDLISADENAVIIDARTENEWLEGALENAILLDVLQPFKFEEEAKKLNKQKNYYVYCRSGQRSMKACALIEAASINNTYNLLGGMMSWTGKKVSPTL